MSEVFYWEKKTTEIKTYKVDFENYLDTGETVSTKTVTVVDSAGADATATIINSSVVDGTGVKMVLKAGTVGETYTVTVTIVSSNAMTYVQNGELEVIAL